MFLFIKFNLLILLYITSHSEANECTQWQQYCSEAKTQSNSRFRCIESSVLYYEPETQTWDRARQLCSQKFQGSQLADLVELSNEDGVNLEDYALQMMTDLEKSGLGRTEFTTSGVCCMRKTGPDTTNNMCQWISSEKEIKTLNVPADASTCQVIIVRLTDGKFEQTHRVGKSDATEYPYLCAYNAPQQCSHPDSPITKPTVSTKPSISTIHGEDNSHKTTDSTDRGNTTIDSDKHNSTQCNYDYKYNGKYGIPYWKPVFPNQSSNNSCPEGYNGHAVWFCLGDNLFDPKGPVITCKKQWLTNIKEQLHYNLGSKELIKICVNLTKSMSNEKMKFYGELDTAVNILEKIQYIIDINKDSDDGYPEVMRNFTEHIIDSCSVMLDKTQAWDNTRPDEKVLLGSKILQYVQYSAFTLGCKQNNSVNLSKRIITDNIVIKTYSMDYKNAINFVVKDKDTSISIPAGIDIEQNLIPDCIHGTAFGAVFDKLSQYLSSNMSDGNVRINSNVVAFSYTNSTQIQPLPNRLNVKIVVKHNTLLKFGDKIHCVYWDFHQKQWSSDGCVYEPLNSNRKTSICVCNHLTNFAALMDVSGQEKPSTVKSILTIVCSMISTISLLLTIGFLTLVRALRNRRSTITCNLCICLLIANILVAFGMDKTENSAICQTISALILYSLLASFSWMLMEGYHLYQMIVLVFSNVGHLRLIWLYTIGYGAPLIIFGSALLGIGFDGGLQGEYFCWISSPYHPYRVWALAGPATFVILANCLIMFLALKAAFSAKVKKNVPKEVSDSSVSDINSSPMKSIANQLSNKFSWMKGYISLIVLMGITWLSYVFYIHEFGQWISYVFIVLNGLQGFFIFMLQIVFNEKARQVVRKHYHKRHPSRYFTSLYKTNSTNAFQSSRSKSLSTGKGNSISSNGLNSDKVIDSNDSDFGTHRGQAIPNTRIRNVSDNILN